MRATSARMASVSAPRAGAGPAGGVQPRAPPALLVLLLLMVSWQVQVAEAMLPPPPGRVW